MQDEPTSPTVARVHGQYRISCVCSRLHRLAAAFPTMDRASKLQKLEAVRRKVPAMSKSAMAGLLKEIEASGLPELKGRRHIKEATEHSVCQHSAYGPMLQTVTVEGLDGCPVQVLLANFFSLLQAVWTVSDSFRALVQRSTSSRQALKLVYYTDEINCGNPLAADASRKLWAVYLSFMDFKAHALSKEQSWLPVTVMRSKAVANMPGGASQLAAVVLRSIFRHDFVDPSVGFQLKAPDGTLHRLRFELGAFCQDGQAHKMLFSVKGDGGTRCCALCNVVANGSVDNEATVVMSQATAEDQLQLSTDSSFAQSIVTLVEKKATLSKANFALWEQACGLVWNEHCLIYQPDLCKLVKPVSQWCHDFMHAFFVKGIWSPSFYACRTLETVSAFVK